MKIRNPRRTRRSSAHGSSCRLDALEPRQLLSGEFDRFDLVAQAGTAALVAGDFNTDGLLDLAAANAGAGSISVLLNGASGFAPAVNYNVGGEPTGLALLDIDDDQIPDLVTFDLHHHKLITLTGSSEGAFTPGPTLNLPTGATAVMAAHFNADPTMDLAIAFAEQDKVSIYVHVDLAAGGGPILGPGVAYSVGDSPSRLAVGDVNRDGILDLVTANTGDDTVSVLTGAAQDPTPQNFLRRLYADLLERPIQGSELSAFAAQLSGGTTRPQLVDALTQAAEFRTREVDRIFRRFLHRQADTIGFSTYLGQLGAGHTFTEVQASVLASNEYYNRAGATPDGFVNALYADLLGRPSEPAGRAGWVQQLADGTSRSEVATHFLSSLEHHTRFIQDLYFSYFHAAPDTDDAHALVAALQDGATLENILSTILSSDKYDSLAGGGQGAFNPAQHFAVGDQPLSVVIDDVNADTRPDLIVTNSGSANISILYQSDDGFAPASNLTAGRAPVFSFGFQQPGQGYILFTANIGDDTVSARLIKPDASSQLLDVIRTGDGPRWIIPGKFTDHGGLAISNTTDGTITIISFRGDRHDRPDSGPPETHDDVPVPGVPNLNPEFDTGDSSTDDITRINNTAGHALAFTVPGAQQGAIVNLFADGVFLGNAPARAAGSVQVKTDGYTFLRDGHHRFTASMTINGREGHQSDALDVEIRTPRIESDLGQSGADQTGRGSTVIRRSDDGHPIVRVDRDRPGHEPHDPQEFDLHDLAGGPDITGDVVAMQEPKRRDDQHQVAERYAAGQSDAGVILYRGRDDDSWDNTNLTDAIPGAEPITRSDLDVFITPWGNVNITGLNDAGQLVMYWQDGTTDSSGQFAWHFANIGDGELAATGQDVPNYTGSLESYVTPWGGLNVAGIDDDGHIQVVWWVPGLNNWVSTDLTELTGAPEFVGSVATYVTPWGGINITGVTKEGTLYVAWWAPGGEWHVSDLAELLGSPQIAQGTAASFTTEDGKLIITAMSTGGEVILYQWSLASPTWTFTPLELPSTQTSPLIGSLSAYAQDSKIVVLASNLAGEALQWSLDTAMPGATWAFEKIAV